MLNQKVIFEAELCSTQNVDARSKGILTEKSLIWEEKSHSKTLSLDDVVGAFSSGKNSFLVNAYHLNPQKQRKLQQYNFTCSSDQVCSLWLTSINNTIMGKNGPETAAPRRLQLILNPRSGKKKTREILTRIIPLLQKSYLEFEVIETTQEDKYNKFLETVTPNKTDALVVIGGDGTVYQLLNKLMKREDWRTAITIPLGIIPAGTSNGLAKTLLEQSGETYNVISAAFIIAKGKQKPIDIVQINQDKNSFYSLLSIGWGLVSEIDIESDRLRYLGSLKTDIYFLTKLFNLPSYGGKFSFLPVINNQTDVTSSGESRDNIPNREEKWQVIEDDFIIFWAMNVPWAAYNIKAAPSAHLSDGAMDVLVIRKGIKKRQLLKTFLSLATGDHISFSYLEYYKVRAFKLEPLNDRDILAIDGEQVPNLPIEVKVLSGVGNVLSY
jgi:sphingosine kinase